MMSRIRVSRDALTPVEEELVRRGRRQLAAVSVVCLAVLALLALRRAD